MAVSSATTMMTDVRGGGGGGCLFDGIDDSCAGRAGAAIVAPPSPQALFVVVV